MNFNPAKLILENGRIFNGLAFGKIGTTLGEVCFNTGMTGYQEIITDPSYCGQIVTLTASHIGNYGTNESDKESNKIHASGIIIKESSPIVSNYRSTNSLQNYLVKNNIVGIQNIDTRALVRIIRNEGAMNGIISSDSSSEKKLIEKLKKHPNMNGMDLVQTVSCLKPYDWNDKNKNIKIAAIDFGIKHNILRLMDKENCYIKVFPASTKINEIQEFDPDGIFLSNGPGDPSAVHYGISMVKNLLDTKIPIFGICLGHQILALALGAKTKKLKFGHRGCNHPVKNLSTNKIEITSQNHGFVVSENNLPKEIIITHISINDQTIEGLKCKNYPAFSIQYHPESTPGPHDSRYLFKEFSKLIKKNKNA